MIAKSSLVCWSVCHFHEKISSSRGETVAHDLVGWIAGDGDGRRPLDIGPPAVIACLTYHRAASAVSSQLRTKLRGQNIERDGKTAAPLTVTFYETGRSYGDVSANPRLERGPGSASYRRTVGSALKCEEKWHDFNPVSKYVSSTVNVRQACNIVWSKIKWRLHHWPDLVQLSYLLHYKNFSSSELGLRSRELENIL